MAKTVVGTLQKWAAKAGGHSLKGGRYYCTGIYLLLISKVNLSDAFSVPFGFR